MLTRKRAVTIGTNPGADGRAPKPSRFPIRVLPTASGNAVWVSAAVVGFEMLNGLVWFCLNLQRLMKISARYSEIDY